MVNSVELMGFAEPRSGSKKIKRATDSFLKAYSIHLPATGRSFMPEYIHLRLTRRSLKAHQGVISSSSGARKSCQAQVNSSSGDRELFHARLYSSSGHPIMVNSGDEW